MWYVRKKVSELTKKGHKTNDDAYDHGDRVERGMEEIEVSGMLGLEDHPEEEEDEAADAGDAVYGEEQVFADGPHLTSVTAAVRKDGGGCSAAAARAPAVGRRRFRFPFLRRLRRRRHRHCLRPNRRIYVLKIKALRLLLNARIHSLRTVENDRDLKGGISVLKGKAYIFSKMETYFWPSIISAQYTAIGQLEKKPTEDVHHRCRSRRRGFTEKMLRPERAEIIFLTTRPQEILHDLKFARSSG